MQTLNKKLRSQRGASITFALLLFLVCAVVGSVVLTAGTAASGRLSRLAELDRRYYNVSSAADFLAQELSDVKVTIVRTKAITESTTTTYTVTVDEETGASTTTEGDTTGPSITSAEYTTTVNGNSIPESTPVNSSFITDRAFRHLFGGSSWNSATFWNCSYNKGKGEAKNESLSMVLKKEDGTTQESLKIVGSYELKKDGTLIIVARDTIGSDHYSLQIIMKPKYREWSNSIPEIQPDVTSELDENNQYTVTRSTKTTDTKTSEISWTLSGISVIEAGGT